MPSLAEILTPSGVDVGCGVSVIIAVDVDVTAAVTGISVDICVCVIVFSGAGVLLLWQAARMKTEKISTIFFMVFIELS